MDINFELYKMFYHAAKESNFSEAAAKLFITQSAVSQGIKKLETKLGLRLFLRKKRTLHLTKEGEILFSHIKQAYNLIKSAEAKLEEVNNLSAGEVRIGASDTVCKYFLLSPVEKFNAEYPRIKIQFFNRTSPQIREALHNGLLDLGIVTVSGREDRFNLTDLYAVEDIFVAGKRFASLEEKPISLEELSRLPLLMLDKKSSTRSLLNAFLSAQGIEIIPEMELESVDFLVELAKIGLGVAHVLKDSARQAICDQQLFPLRLTTKLPTRELGIITPKGVPLSQAAQKFIDLLLIKE